MTLGIVLTIAFTTCAAVSSLGVIAWLDELDRRDEERRQRWQREVNL